MEREARLQGILHISQKPHLSGSPVKESSLKAPLMESYAERCPTTTALLRSSIKVPGIRAPPHTRFPSAEKRSPRREMPVSGDLFNTSSSVPSEGVPPPRHPPRSLFRERETLHPQSPLYHLSKSPIDEPSSRFPKRGPYGRRCLSPEPFSTYPTGSAAREPSLHVPFTDLPQRETLHQPYLKVPGKGTHSRWPN